MPASKRKYFHVYLLFLTLLSLSPALWVPNACAQSMLPAGMEVKKVYRAGSGLPVGKIQSVWGDVVIVHAGSEEAYRVKTGLPLYRRDTIITNRNAGLSCRLRDGSTFKLAAYSKLQINLSAHDTQRKSSILSLFLIGGKAHFQIAKLEDFEPREFKVETDSFIARGRRADFAVLLLEEHTEIIAFRESLLEVMSLENPEQKIFLSEFQRAEIEGGELPSNVEIFPVEQASQFLSDFQQHSDQRLSGLTFDQIGEDETVGDEAMQKEAGDRDPSLIGFP
jgi:hypothetical protein